MIALCSSSSRALPAASWKPVCQNEPPIFLSLPSLLPQLWAELTDLAYVSQQMGIGALELSTYMYHLSDDCRLYIAAHVCNCSLLTYKHINLFIKYIVLDYAQLDVDSMLLFAFTKRALYRPHF